MGFISEQIEKIYKSVLFKRRDMDGSVFYFCADDFPGLSAEEFSFKSKRGHLLYGCFYYYGEKSSDRLILFEHGMGNGHRGYFREIEHLAKSGYTVFAYDHTGCARSEGEHIYGLSGSLSDLDDCISTLVLSGGYTEEQISVIGHSWGGFSTMNILDRHPRLRSIVALSGFSSIRTMQKQVISGLLSLFRDRLFELELKTNPEYADSRADDVLSRTDRPVLIIHSTDDATVSYKANFLPLRRDLSAKNNIRFISVSGSGHSPQYTPDAFAYKELFFRDLKRARRQKRLETDSQKKEFIAKYDWKRMTEQNTDLWGRICVFLEEKG